MKTWKIRCSDHASARSLADVLKVPLPLAKILVSRGYDTPEAASAFLYASMEDLSRPFELPNMGAAVESIGKAIEAKKKIVIYGDYDVDGICASSVLREAFSWFGVEARVYIPSRFKDGYGMNANALQLLLDEGAELLITVDNGIAAADLVKTFSAKGLEFIVTDHHQIPENVPECIIVNPLLAPQPFLHYRHMCGCGTAYMLAMGMLIRLAPEKYDEAHRRALLDLVALATVADIMPLREDNRILVREGLKEINTRKRPGLAALVQLLCGDEAVVASDIAFRLAPCLNACGRLDRTDDALALLMAEPTEEIEALAETVRGYNDERKELERTVTNEAIAQFEDFHGHMHCAIAVGENWHPGVIGIVASRLVEHFHCPALVLTTTEEKPDVYTGSGRSVPGFHLFHGLQAVDAHLMKYGGHEGAAGLSVAKDQLDAFIAAFTEVAMAAEETIEEEILWLDDVLKIEDVTDALEENLRLVEPCGQDNPLPIFAMEHQWRFEHRPVGKDGAHLRFVFENADGDKIPGIAFRQGDYAFSDKHRYDFAFHLNQNCYRGNCNVQLQITDIAPSWQAADDPLLHAFMKHGKNYLDTDGDLADQPQFYTKLRGVSFGNRQAVLKKLEAGESLLLMREENNPVDANAIACLTQQKEQLGYLSRQIAAQLAPLIDLGASYTATLEEITGSDQETLGANILVRNCQAVSERMEPEAANAVSPELSQEVLIDILTDAFVEDGTLLPIQQAAIHNILDRHENTAVIMPTGRGKSLIYQIAAGVLARREKQCTIVISPLKALIQDQYLALCDALEPLGYRIYRGNGDLRESERQALYQAIEADEVDILLATPEFFVRHQGIFQPHISKIGQIVIDEAHYMVSKREAYKKLRALKETYSSVVWTFLTATVPTTQADAFREIILDAGLYIDDYIRYNLNIIDARHTDKKLVTLYRLFMRREKTICYINSRKQAFGLAQRLREILPYQLRSLVGYYHGGLPQQARRAVESAFKEGELRLLFATTAFGEGVNIPDIRNVVLYHPCFSVESFNQLAGRCARDGEPGSIHLLYNEKDFALNEMIIADRGPARDELVRMYQLLKLKGKQEGYVISDTPANIALQLLALDDHFTKSQWNLAIKIFTELEFLEVTKTEERITIEIKQAPAHRTLTDSVTYLEGIHEARALEQFQEIAFIKDINRLEEIIRSALRPANWNGREVKT